MSKPWTPPREFRQFDDFSIHFGFGVAPSLNWTRTSTVPFVHFQPLMKPKSDASQNSASLGLKVAMVSLMILGAISNLSVSLAEEEGTIRLTRKTSKSTLFGSSSKMTERDVYEFATNAKISCSRETKKILKKENITNPTLKSKENIYLSLLDGLATMSRLSPTMADRLLLRMKAYPLGISCISAIKKTPEDLYMSILAARLIPHLKAGKDELGDIHEPKDIVQSCGRGSLRPNTDDCQLCARAYIGESDGKISVSANWEDRIAAKDTCSYFEKTQTSLLQK